MERKVAYHLGNLKGNLESLIVEEEVLSNADETNFVVDLTDGKMLDVKGNENFKFSDVVSSNFRKTVMVMLGGGLCSHLRVSLNFFQNDRS